MNNVVFIYVVQEVASLLEEAVVTTFDDVDTGANDSVTTRRRTKLVCLQTVKI